MIKKNKRQKSKILSLSLMTGQKKGFLLAEETLKIVIALIAISFLIYFLTSLYFAKINEIEYEKAKVTLIDSDESLKATIENLNDGETREYLINDPDDWHLVSFTGITKPNLCAGNSCLCICKDSRKNIQSQVKQCDDKNNGICTPANIDRDVKIKIQKDITKISIQKTNGEISIIRLSPEETAFLDRIFGKPKFEPKGPTPVSGVKGEQPTEGEIEKEAGISEGTSQTEPQEEEGIFTAALDGLKTIWGKIRGTKLDSPKSDTSVIGTKGNQETGIMDEPAA